MKTTKDYEIEISRNNVSAAEFLAYLRRMKKTHPEMASDFDLEDFRAGDDWNPEYHNGVPGIHPASAEIVKNRPYDKQTYCRWFDGTTYNEIIEWECDDATTGKGHGYYYTVQLSVADEDSAANTAEELTKTAHRLTEKAAGLSKQALLMRQYIATSREYLDGAWVRLHSDEAEMWQREADEYRRNAALCIKEAAKAAAEVQTETITENETTKEDDTMTTETTTNTETTTTEQEAEAVSFPRLRAELLTNAQRQKDEASERIGKGYLERWNPASRPASLDDGIRYYSTATRWEQYQRGEITREKAVELATKRAYKQIDQDTARKCARLDSVAAARLPSALSVCVTWARSRTWGTNLTATVYGDTRRTEGHASGCGYDKESAAIADAMNQQPEALRVLYDMAEKALADGQRPDSKTACTGYCWHSLLGYGSGYSVLPYFEGGCGSNTIWAILQKGGYTVRHTHSAKALDCWTVDKAESGKGVA